MGGGDEERGRGAMDTLTQSPSGKHRIGSVFSCLTNMAPVGKYLEDEIPWKGPLSVAILVGGKVVEFENTLQKRTKGHLWQSGYRQDLAATSH